MSSRIRNGLPAVLGLGLALFGCRRAGDSAPVEPAPEPELSASVTSDKLADPAGPPPRWVIDGTTLADDPSLPLALDRALRDFGRASEDVQDHILADLNGDARLDAVVLLPAPAVVGAYDHLVLLSEGERAKVHVIAEMVPGASFSAAVVPLVDGPTLVGVAPRIGGCERGPEWTFLRPTGAMLESVGSVRVEDYDCAVAEASIEFDRAQDGRVAAVIVRHGDAITRYRWDAALGSFAAIND
jgi:hypothetical protein